MATGQQLPTCSALVLCDAVFIEKATGKHFLLGIFDVIRAAQLPAVCQGAVYFSLTDAIGEWDLHLQIVHADDIFQDGDPQVPKMPLKIKSDDPNLSLERSLVFAGPLNQFGVYHLELVAQDGTLIQTKRFTLVDANANTQGD